MSSWQNLLKGEIPHLFIYLESILQNGGNKYYRLYSRPIPFRNIRGLSGYYYQIDNHEAMVGLGLARDNQSFVLYRKYFENNQWHERYDYFNSQGIYNYFSETLISPLLENEQWNMDPTCPVINILYNYLAHEYAEAENGTSQTDRVFTIEKFLQKLYHSNKIRLSIKDRSQDLAITQMFFRMNEGEMDPVLNWEERLRANEVDLDRLDKILQTKFRVHRMYSFLFALPLLMKRFFSSIRRFFKRPADNIKGIAFYWTIGQIFSVFKFIRHNPGSALVLASYIGFAYFYITLPKNPYVTHIKNELTPLLQESKKLVVDEVSVKSAAPVVEEILVVEKETLAEFAHSQIGPKARVEAFKKLAESFEKNLELPQQEGRKIEFRNKLLYPTMIEAAWSETQNYLSRLEQKQRETFSINLKQYIENEKSRTLYVQTFLWETMDALLTDNSEILLDQNDEQLKSDAYFGRGMSLFSDMSLALASKVKNLPQSAQKDRIEQLAQIFHISHQETGSVVNNLKANSNILKQKSPIDSEEYRQSQKRQWEILFLQHSKKDALVQKGQERLMDSKIQTIWFLERFFAEKNQDQLSKSSLENLLFLNQVSLLSGYKEIAANLPQEAQVLLAINEMAKKSISELELVSNNQKSDHLMHANKSVSRH